MSDPRDAKNLEEACKNPNGTYNGLRALSYISGIPLEEVAKVAEEAKRKVAERKLLK